MKVGDLVKWTGRPAWLGANSVNKYGLVIAYGHDYFDDSVHIEWFDGEASGWYQENHKYLELLNESR